MIVSAVGSHVCVDVQTDRQDDSERVKKIFGAEPNNPDSPMVWSVELKRSGKTSKRLSKQDINTTLEELEVKTGDALQIQVPGNDAQSR